MERINLCTMVRNAVGQHGVSTVKLVDAVNAALGQLEPKSSSDKLGDGKLAKKGAAYSVTHTVATKYTGRTTYPLTFDAWNSLVGKLEKSFPGSEITVPPSLLDWVLKFKEASVPEPSVPEPEECPDTGDALEATPEPVEWEA